MSRGTIIALAVFVACCAGLMGWLLFADGPGAAVSTEAPIEGEDVAARAAEGIAALPLPSAALPRATPAAPPPAVAVAAARDMLVEVEPQIDAEGDIDRGDMRAVARFVLARTRPCLVDFRAGHADARGQLRVEVGVHNAGAVAALLNDIRLAEDPFADPTLELCIRRALNGKGVAVSALAIDARVAVPVSVPDADPQSGSRGSVK